MRSVEAGSKNLLYRTAGAILGGVIGSTDSSWAMAAGSVIGLVFGEALGIVTEHAVKQAPGMILKLRGRNRVSESTLKRLT